MSGAPRLLCRGEEDRGEKHVVPGVLSGLGPILRTAISTSASYLALIVLLRVAGQRTLAKWYAFDLIVTVALGSTFANTVLAKDITVAQAVVGFIILVGLQFVISWIVLHWSPMRQAVNSPPSLVLQDGEFRNDAMRSQRVAEADVRGAKTVSLTRGGRSCDPRGGRNLQRDQTRFRVALRAV